MLFICRTHQKQEIQNKMFLILISVYHCIFKCSCWKKYLAKISVEGALHNTINCHTQLKCSAFLSRHFFQDKTRLGLTDIEGSNKTRTLTPRLGVEKNKLFLCLYNKCLRETCITILKSGMWANDRVTFFVTENTHRSFWQKQWRGSWDMTLNPVKMSFRQSRAATCHT